MIKPVKLWSAEDYEAYGAMILELMSKDEGVLLVRMLEDMSARIGQEALQDPTVSIEWYRGAAAVVQMLLTSFRALSARGEESLASDDLFTLPVVRTTFGVGGA